MHARLSQANEPHICSLLAQGEQLADGPWLRLLTPTLNRPGSELRRTLLAHSQGASAVALLADEKVIVSGGVDGTVKVWNLLTGDLKWGFVAHGAKITAIAILAHDRIVATGSEDGFIRIWDIQDQAEIRALRGNIADRVDIPALSVGSNAISTLATDAERQLLVACGPWGYAVWNSMTGQEVCRHARRQLTFPISACAVMPDGRRLLAGYDRGDLKILDLMTGAELESLTGHKSGVGPINQVHGTTDTICSVAISADGRIAASASSDHRVGVWDLSREAQGRMLTGHSSAVNAIALRGTGAWPFRHRRMASCGYGTPGRLDRF